VPRHEARLLHFELRDTAEALYKKWTTLAAYESDSSSDKGAPWLERIQTFKNYVRDYKDKADEIRNKWFFEHRTFWGSIIPEDRVVFDTHLSLWYRRYFRQKVDSGEVQSVCLVRSGNLGDVVMTEPIAKFLSKRVGQVNLATRIPSAKSLFTTYHEVLEFDQLQAGNGGDLKIKLVYELSSNDKSYIQAYFESIGFGEIKSQDIPQLRDDYRRIVEGEYILFALLRVCGKSISELGPIRNLLN